MANPLPAWAQVGADVAAFTPGRWSDPQVRLLTIEKVTATQAVTSDGVRWVNSSSDGAPKMRAVGHVTHSDTILIPADDPRTVDALQRQELLAAEAAVNRAHDKWRQDRRGPQPTAALAAAAAHLADLAARYASKSEDVE